MLSSFVGKIAKNTTYKSSTQYVLLPTWYDWYKKKQQRCSCIVDLLGRETEVWCFLRKLKKPVLFLLFLM